MRAVFYYIVAVVSLALISMFFISQHSRNIQVRYELTQLRAEREALREEARKLDVAVSRGGSHNALAESARRLGLPLQPPVAGRPR